MEMLDQEYKQETSKILNGKGFHLDGIIVDRYRPLRSTFNIITSDKTNDAFTDDQNDGGDIY